MMYKGFTWSDFQFVAAFMPKIKAGRSITVDTLCDFSEADNMPKAEDRVLESNTQPQSIISKVKEDDRAEEENLTIASHMVIAGAIFCNYPTIWFLVIITICS
jgi:hypothetical protein